MSFDEHEKLHMPAVRRALGGLPARMFLDISTAPFHKDVQQATDLILSVSSGDVAVRVRGYQHWMRSATNYGFDWSVRAHSRNGGKTEIEKLREGFARWYFYGFSADDKGTLADWWLLDMNKVRASGILERHWKIHQNGDGTAGMYIPMAVLEELHCIVHYEPYRVEVPVFVG